MILQLGSLLNADSEPGGEWRMLHGKLIRLLLLHKSDDRRKVGLESFDRNPDATNLIRAQ